jgi:hypothetical protein
MVAFSVSVSFPIHSDQIITILHADNVSPGQPDEGEKKRQVTESVYSWLSDVWEWTRGDVDEKMAPSTSDDESSHSSDAPEIQLPSSP